MGLEQLNGFSGMFGARPWLMVLLLAWSLVWKGFALWKAAHKNQSVWFVVMLVLNTVGILEILYLFVFSNWKIKKETAHEETQQ